MNPRSAENDRLYKTVADELRCLIEGGTFAVGTRLPSVRKMAEERGVSISTVLKAYQTLEDTAHIRARPQSGYYVLPRPASTCPDTPCSEPPATPTPVAIGTMVYELLDAVSDPELVPLGGALPSAELLPVPGLRRLLRNALRQRDAQAEVDARPIGFTNLRRVIARRMLRAGCTVAPDEIVVTNGCMEALNIALRAVAKPGDAVAVESPAYFGTLQALDDLGLRALEMPTDSSTGIHAEKLCEIARQGRIQAAVLSPTVQNPLGATMPEADKELIAKELGALDIPVIEDDIYGELTFGNGIRPSALKAFDDEGNVLYCSSFSKTVAPGYRVGWLAGGRHLQRARVLKASSSFASSGPAQLAVAAFVEQPGYETHLRRLRRTFETTVDHLMESVVHSFPDGTRMTRPQGGYLLWIQVPGVDTRQLYRHALSHGISIAPGCLFSARDSFPDYLRLNGGHIWNDRFERAIETLGQLAASLSKR